MTQMKTAKIKLIISYVEQEDVGTDSVQRLKQSVASREIGNV
jgi:hypothetical protein